MSKEQMRDEEIGPCSQMIRHQYPRVPACSSCLDPVHAPAWPLEVILQNTPAHPPVRPWAQLQPPKCSKQDQETSSEMDVTGSRTKA